MRLIKLAKMAVSLFFYFYVLLYCFVSSVFSSRPMLTATMLPCLCWLLSSWLQPSQLWYWVGPAGCFPMRKKCCFALTVCHQAKSGYWLLALTSMARFWIHLSLRFMQQSKYPSTYMTNVKVMYYLLQLIDSNLLSSKSYFCSSRSLALQKLWRYCMSVVCGSILRWSVVITRVGNAGWEEIAGQCCNV